MEVIPLLGFLGHFMGRCGTHEAKSLLSLKHFCPEKYKQSTFRRAWGQSGSRPSPDKGPSVSVIISKIEERIKQLVAEGDVLLAELRDYPVARHTSRGIRSHGRKPRRRLVWPHERTSSARTRRLHVPSTRGATPSRRSYMERRPEHKTLSTQVSTATSHPTGNSSKSGPYHLGAHQSRSS